MRKNFKFITLMLALTLSLVTAAFGQRTTGDIEGTITDPTGAVVPNVSVTVSSTGDSGFKRTVQANADGFFRVQQIPPGMYSVSTGAISGFGATERKVSVAVDATAAVNITLAVGGGNTVVDVTGGDSAPIDVGGSKVSSTISSLSRTSHLPIKKRMNHSALLRSYRRSFTKSSSTIQNE